MFKFIDILLVTNQSGTHFNAGRKESTALSHSSWVISIETLFWLERFFGNNFIALS